MKLGLPRCAVKEKELIIFPLAVIVTDCNRASLMKFSQAEIVANCKIIILTAFLCNDKQTMQGTFVSYHCGQLLQALIVSLEDHDV